MGLNSPGGENLLIFSSCGRCSRLTMGTLGTRSGGLRKCQSPCELLGGHLGFLYRRCRALRPCVDSVPETEDSSPMLTWIFGYFWSLPRGVSPRFEWGHARALSSRAMRRKRSSSGCGRDSRASSRVETDMSGNFLSCSKGVKDSLEVPELRCD